MAGVSVQAFRRQGRRYGAGLVCSEMVSCAGIEHRNEKTLGYLRVASDEHPLAIQLFGSDPDDGRRRAHGRGRRSRHRRRQLRLPGEEGDEDGRRRAPPRGSGSRVPDHRARSPTRSSVPVTVKLRRGVQNGSRAALELGPRLVEAGASSLTLHPRSAQQMYTGTADHALTAELVSLVDVPVVASGDVTSRARAQTVLATTGAEAVMVGRGARETRGRFARSSTGTRPSRHARRSQPSSCSSSARRFASWASAGRRLPQEVLRLVPGPGTLPEGVQAGAPAARLDRGGRAPVARRRTGRFEIVERLEAEIPSGEELTLELPVSIYGGG